MMQARDNARASESHGSLHAVLQDDADNAIAYDNLPAILRILDDACSQRATLTIRLACNARLHIYHARIQSVNAVNKEMVLHKLTPSNWAELVKQEFDVEVSCQLSSGLLRFHTTIAPLEADTISPYCVLALPSLLLKHQLRSSYRVSMPPGASSLSFPHGERQLQGFCLNLSLEGCCGIFRGDLDTLTRDVRVPALTVSLDDSLQFTTDATICRRQVMQNGSTQLGLRFEALDLEVQRKLQASLTNLQRRQLRKRA